MSLSSSISLTPSSIRKEEETLSELLASKISQLEGERLGDEEEEKLLGMSCLPDPFDFHFGILGGELRKRERERERERRRRRLGGGGERKDR